ncbi:acyltransferase [Erwinia amylovora]|uniref:acyltransferase n=1 Tax=Erwinia amylovora TaxID=552 RepID=UPI0014439A21|nr:acyltransferase [Erwinia amylovora]
MRILAIDLLKILAIFFVIISHVTLFFLSGNEQYVFLYFFRQSGQWGVVVFFICSGYFLLSNKHEDQTGYILNKVRRLMTILLFWIIFYYLYDTYLISQFTAVENVIFLQYVNVSGNLSDATHLWFIFSITALYILTPLLRCAFSEDNAKGILQVLIIMVVVANLTLFNALTDYEFSFKSIPFNILLPFQSEGLISFLIGGYLALVKPKIRSFSLTHIMLLLISVGSFTALSLISFRTGMVFFYGKFYNILLLTSSVCLFLFMVNINISRIPAVVDDISKNVLGIYLVHNIFVVEVHSDFIHNSIREMIGGTNNYIYIVIYSLFSFTLSYILCVLLRKSKFTRKIITL